MKCILLVTLLFSVYVCGVAQNQNMIGNGGFENGNFDTYNVNDFNVDPGVYLCIYSTSKTQRIVKFVKN